MIFNEILIPQDSFTETNVTRKRFVVENFIYLPKNTFVIFKTFFILTQFNGTNLIHYEILIFKSKHEYDIKHEH